MANEARWPQGRSRSHEPERPHRADGLAGATSPELRAERYRLARDGARHGDNEPQAPGDARVPKLKSTDNVGQRADAIVTRAMREGDFDNLKYAGKPLPNLATSDPDWWLKALIQRENLTGLAPPAIMLRHEDAALPEILDRLPSEKSVAAHVEDFNRRIVEARRQLQGGPPVVTKLRDRDAEVAAWRERRAARRAATRCDEAQPRGRFFRLFRKAS